MATASSPSSLVPLAEARTITVTKPRLLSAAEGTYIGIHAGRVQVAFGTELWSNIR
jgi:hypothetical protein